MKLLHSSIQTRTMLSKSHIINTPKIITQIIFLLKNSILTFNPAYIRARFFQGRFTQLCLRAFIVAQV